MKKKAKEEKKEKKPRKIKEEEVIKNKTPLTKEEIGRIRESEVGRVLSRSILTILGS